MVRRAVLARLQPSESRSNSNVRKLVLFTKITAEMAKIISVKLKSLVF